MGSEWPEVQLQDIVTKLGDGLHGTPQYTEDGDYFFINGNNLDNGRIAIKPDTKRVSLDEYEKHKKVLNSRTLLVSINGTIGNIAYYKDEPVILGKSACYFNLHENVSRPFVRYILSGHLFRQYLESYSTGSTIKNVSLKMMREFSFPLPPLPEQKAIAHILGTLDDKIELNRRMNATLEGMAQALFKSWFVDFDPVIDNALAAGNPIPDELAPRAEVRRQALAKDTTQQSLADHPTLYDRKSLFPAAFQLTEELGWIPEGWDLHSIASALGDDAKKTVKTGPFGSNLHSSDYAETGRPLILVKNVNNGEVSMGGLPLVAHEKASELSDYFLKKNDIVVTRVGRVGDTALITKVQEGWMFSGQMLRVRLPEESGIVAQWLASYYRSAHFKDSIESYSVGSTRASLNTKILTNLRFCLPTRDAQSIYAKELSRMGARAMANRLQGETLIKLRDTLLPKLISGELHVSSGEQLSEEGLA